MVGIDPGFKPSWANIILYLYKTSLNKMEQDWWIILSFSCYRFFMDAVWSKVFLYQKIKKTKPKSNTMQ